MVACRAHNPKVVGSNPTSATTFNHVDELIRLHGFLLLTNKLAQFYTLLVFLNLLNAIYATTNDPNIYTRSPNKILVCVRDDGKVKNNSAGIKNTLGSK